jgi:hypothetical protein
MYVLPVSTQVVRRLEVQITINAMIRFFCGVSPFMALQSSWVRIACTTHITPIWLLSCVQSQVSDQAALATRPLPTVTASVVKIFNVTLFMDRNRITQNYRLSSPIAASAVQIFNIPLCMDVN